MPREKIIIIIIIINPGYSFMAAGKAVWRGASIHRLNLISHLTKRAIRSDCVGKFLVISTLHNISFSN